MYIPDLILDLNSSLQRVTALSFWKTGLRSIFSGKGIDGWEI